MQVVGSKLSKHVLGMKFMRKTKDQLDQDVTEKNHRKHFGVKVGTSSTSKAKDIKSKTTSNSAVVSNIQKSEKLKRTDCSTGATLPNTLTKVEEISSYSQCLGYSFGRFSFGGFNPVVEYNMKRGKWQAGYSNTTVLDASDEEDVESNEKDIGDKEMAELRGGSLIGSLGKHFMSKRQRSEEERRNKASSQPILDESDVRANRNNNKKANQPGWKKDSEKGQSKSSWFNANGQEALRKNPHKDSPPAKRRKFMKPSDD